MGDMVAQAEMRIRGDADRTAVEAGWPSKRTPPDLGPQFRRRAAHKSTSWGGPAMGMTGEGFALKRTNTPRRLAAEAVGSERFALRCISQPERWFSRPQSP